MSQNILFETSRFSASGPNAIPGQELLRWLGEQLTAHGVTIEQGHAKGAAWEATATHGSVRYVLTVPTASGSQWKITIDKQRGLSDRLFAKNQLSPTDPFVWLVENSLQGDSNFRNVRRAK